MEFMHFAKLCPRNKIEVFRGAIRLSRKQFLEVPVTYNLMTTRKKSEADRYARLAIAYLTVDTSWRECARARIERDLVIAVRVPGEGVPVLLERTAVDLYPEVLAGREMRGQSPGINLVASRGGR
jgi:hypothetical protein